MMKQWILTLLLPFGVISASANDNLAASMEIIGDQFKVLATAIQSQNLTEAELVAVQQMQDAIADAALEYPDDATDDVLKLQYSRWMAQLMRMAIDFENQAEVALAEEAQDLAAVTQTLVNMNELRKEAHSVFKPE